MFFFFFVVSYSPDFKCDLINEIFIQRKVILQSCRICTCTVGSKFCHSKYMYLEEIVRCAL